MTARLRAVAGYTLTEMMIVVAVIGIVTAVAVPNFLDWNRRYKLRDAVGTLSGNLSLARMAAINQNATVTVAVTQPAAPGPVTVAFTSPAGAVLAPLTLDTEVSLTNAGGATACPPVCSPQEVQFNARGFRLNPATTPNGGNNICIGACGMATPQVLNFVNTQGVNYRIVIQPTGKVSWCVVSTCIQ